MIIVPTTEEEIKKQSNIPALIRNQHGVEMVIDLYTAKRLAVNNECEILEENFSQKPKAEKAPAKTKNNTKTGDIDKTKTPANTGETK